MINNRVKNKIARIIEEIKSLKYNFYDAQNKEDSLRVLNTSIIYLNEYEVVIDRDKAYENIRNGFSGND